MLQFGRNIAEKLRHFLNRRAGTITATSIIAAAYVSSNDKRTNRKLVETEARYKSLEGKLTHIETTFGAHKKEFEEFLQWKADEQKVLEKRLTEKIRLISELPELVKGDVPQGDTFVVTSQGDALTITRQGDSFTIAGQGETFTIALQGDTFTITDQGDTIGITEQGDAFIIAGQDDLD